MVDCCQTCKHKTVWQAGLTSRYLLPCVCDWNVQCYEGDFSSCIFWLLLIFIPMFIFTEIKQNQPFFSLFHEGKHFSLYFLLTYFWKSHWIVTVHLKRNGVMMLLKSVTFWIWCNPSKVQIFFLVHEICKRSIAKQQ